MKTNFAKKFLTVFLCFMTVLGMLCFMSCGEKAGGNDNTPTTPTTPTTPGDNVGTSGDNGGTGGNSGSGGTSGGNGDNTGTGGTSTDSNKLYLFDEEMNPEYATRTEALDTIFNPDVLGQMVLVMDRSEWNKHLDYCDYSLQHENSVVAKGFYFTKDNKEWFFKDIGFRIRGNTSRIRPQEKKADGTNGKYVQAHFALDFEEWITDEQDEAGVEKKLADSMKGVILKRPNNDSTYAREIYGYNLFRQNGIWIAPRAAYTTLKIQIIDDLDLDKDGNTTEFETVNFGVYGMIEEIKKQFLKERTSKEGGGELESNKGNLWKCLWQNKGSDFVKDNATSIGEEDVELEFDKDGKITGFRRTTYDYDYKGDNELAEGKEQLLNFMEELNNLPDCTDGNNDDDDIKTIKEFYTKKMDGDLFLRTYAINVILGMWDDYWINKNNFYFYFDKNGKAYFIPYDYDNILGTNGCDTDAGTKNPLEWRNLSDNENKRPLIQKILQVPEFMDAYKSYLNQYSNEDSYFDDDKSIAQIKKWHNMIKNHIASKDLAYYLNLNDEPASWGTPYSPYTIYTPGNMNYFTVRQNAIKKCINPTREITLTLNAGKGYFSTKSGVSQTLTYKFLEGQSTQTILSQNNFYGWVINHDSEKKVWYAYQDDDGSYYYPIAFTNANGKVETNWKNFTLYEDTTYDTLYRKFDELLPYKFNEDYSKVTFTFRPADYNNLPNNISSVHLMSNFTEGGWDPADVNKLTKSSDGNYSITLNTTDIYNMWPTFKFIVNEVNWFGGIEFKYNLPSEYIQGANADFNLVFPTNTTISFDLNEGDITGSLEPSYSTNKNIGCDISKFFNYELSLQNPTKDGFVFEGWTLTKDGDDYVQEIPFGKITVYAKWLEQKTCTLTLDASGYGYYLNKNGEEVSILEIPFETGDNFWDIIYNNNGDFYGNTDDNGQYSLWYYKDSSGNNINGILIDSITVYPVCEYHEKVTYIFNANGGTFSDGTEIYEEVFTNLFSYYTPYLEGYTFKGWSTATTGGVFINNITKDLEGHTLYARWCKDDDFFVKSALVGDFGEGHYLIPEEDGTHTYTFTYDKNQLWWESAEGSLQFKLQKLNGDWNDSYGSANPTIGGDYVECFTGDQNITVSGLTHGTTYTITFKYENDCVYVKIAETE